MSDKIYYCAVDIAPDDKHFVVITFDGHIEIRRLNDGQLISSIAAKTSNGGTYNRVYYSKDGKRLIVNRDDREVIVFDIATLKEIYHLEIHEGVIISTTLSPNGRYLCMLRANCERDKYITLWDTHTWQQIRAFTPEADAPNGYAEVAVFAPDGKYLLTKGGYDRVLLWDVATGKLDYHFDFMTCEIHAAIAYAPDGQTVIAAQEDIRLFRVSDGVELRHMKTQSEFLSAATYSPDSHRIYLCGNENTWCWDSTTGQIMWSTSKPDNINTDLALTSDGSKLLVVGTQGSIQLLDSLSGTSIWKV